MKFTDISPNIITEQLNENELPPKFAQIAVRDFGMSKEELMQALKAMSFKAFMSLMNAFNFNDYDDARTILMRAANIKGRIGLEPQEEDIDDDRAGADADAADDDYESWVSDHIASEYSSVYDILEKMDVDEDPWMAIEKMLPDGDAETSYVDEYDVKSFAATIMRQPQKAIKKFVLSKQDIIDDSDVYDKYNDEREETRLGPDAYRGVSRYD